MVLDAWGLDLVHLDELSPHDNQCGRQALVHCTHLQTHLKTNQAGLNLSPFLHEPAT